MADKGQPGSRISPDGLSVLESIAESLKKGLAQKDKELRLREREIAVWSKASEAMKDLARAVDESGTLLDDILYLADELGKLADDNDGQLSGMELSDAMKKLRAKRDKEESPYSSEEEEEEEEEDEDDGEGGEEEGAEPAY